MEHSWVGNDFVNAALSLVYNNAKRIAWIGDYADDPYEHMQDNYAKVMPYDEFMVYYTAAWESDGKKTHKISQGKFTKSDLSIFDIKTVGMYLINHDLREYVDLADYVRDCSITQNDETWCINPLPLLTACGNDRGGGDFHSGNAGYEYVGAWAFAHIEYTSEISDGYTKKDYKFIEDSRG